ncbi:hypothetical protein [Paeniclostridium hominis]|uniref:hypothetical protein n=1 Tax=Paeniclostridium hominis TaxID=2764329 RepID=UPI0022E8A3F1|nr:hypothetical protein [Paeniclostridium hominis]
MEQFKLDLKNLLESIENKEILVMLKENFILNENEEFNYEYKDKSKELYFKNFRKYIDKLEECMNKQVQISKLELDDLYKISEYESYENILYTLEWSVEYLRNNYIEINLHNESVLKNSCEKGIKLDLEKICTFLDTNKNS